MHMGRAQELLAGYDAPTGSQDALGHEHLIARIETNIHACMACWVCFRMWRRLGLRQPSHL